MLKTPFFKLRFKSTLSTLYCTSSILFSGVPRLLCCHDVTELFMLDFELLNLELLLLKKRRKGSWKNRRIPAEVLSSRMRKGERFKRL